MPSPTAISLSQLSRLIGTPGSPVIIDVCSDTDFKADPRLIPGSLRLSVDRALLDPAVRGSKIVTVCCDGRALSQGAAALLRAQGISAENLEGGKQAWRDAGEPLVPLAKLPKADASGQTLWVTRQRPKIDRIACPWLIRRFVDPRAQFLFIAPSEVLNVAERLSGTPFDVEGVFWSHREERCTFDTMLEEFALETEPLRRVADIVRGADTNRHDLAAQAPGLLAISLGLSRMYRDDLQQLEAGMLVYDALYRWSRDAVDEGHDWPAAISRP